MGESKAHKSAYGFIWPLAGVGVDGTVENSGVELWFDMDGVEELDMVKFSALGFIFIWCFQFHLH